MLHEHSFTEARSNLTTIVDYVQNMNPQVIRRRKKTEKDVLMISVELQKELLSYLSFQPEILNEEDGSVTLAFDPLELYVNQPTLEEAYHDLARELVEYTSEYIGSLGLFLQSPNRKSHVSYILRLSLCNSEAEVYQLLQEHASKEIK